MQFSQDNEWFQVSWISGPRHNFLALKFTDDSNIPTKFHFQPPNGTCFHGELNQDRIILFVLKGVEKASKSNKTNLFVEAVKCIKNDTPPEEIYEFLAQKIVEWKLSEDTS